MDILDHDSDHFPIESIFNLETQRTQKKRYLWKDLDIEKFLSTLDGNSLFLENMRLETKEDIDIYVRNLTIAIHEAIKGLVPLKKGSTYDKGF